MDLFRRPLPRGLARLSLLSGLALVCLLAPVHAQGVKSDSKVKITAQASKADAEGRQTITLTLAIDKGWHLYANPVGHKDLEGAQTSVTIKAGQPLRNVKIDYPPGLVHKDKDAGDYNIYEGTVVIKVHVQRTPGDASPMEVAILLQACSKVCLLPVTVKLMVK